MADVLIIGDGPAGLSAALFLTKNGQNVTVFGQDGTPMHKAMLYNYLGIPEMTGSEFQRVGRAQVQNLGGKIEDVEVTAAEKTDGGFAVTTADWRSKRREVSHFWRLAQIPNWPKDLSLAKENKGIVADGDGRTSVEGLFAVGWNTRLIRTQAIISAGQGAATALEILSLEAGEDFHDFDVVE